MWLTAGDCLLSSLMAPSSTVPRLSGHPAVTGTLWPKVGRKEMLAGKSNRSLYVINNAQTRLDQLTKANLVTQAGSEAALMTFMQAVTTTELDSLINWTKGWMSTMRTLIHQP